MAVPTDSKIGGNDENENGVNKERNTSCNANDSDENTTAQVFEPEVSCASSREIQEIIIEGSIESSELRENIQSETMSTRCKGHKMDEIYLNSRLSANRGLSFCFLCTCYYTLKLFIGLQTLFAFISVALKENMKLKYLASTSAFSENIRLTVPSFFSRKFNFKKYIRGVMCYFDNPRKRFPTCLFVYPAHTLSEYYREVESNPDLPVAERMKYDLLRTSSFSNFPTNCPVSTLSIAKAGFYFQGNGDEVICFCCGIKHRNWQFRDDPVTIHRRISPNCCFIRSLELPRQSSIERSDRDQGTLLYSRQANVGNKTPTVTQENETHESGVPVEYHTTNYESQNVNPQSNINYVDNSEGVSNSNVHTSSRTTNNDDRSISQQVQEGDSGAPYQSNVAGPSRDSNLSAENDTSQNNTGDTNISSSSSNAPQATGSSAPSTLEPLGISIAKPKYPQYAVLATRMSSFNNWPVDIGQRPEDLAKAGFVYEGMTSNNQNSLLMQ